MQITRNNSVKTAAGPSEWFTGAVYIDTVATPSAAREPASRMRAGVVPTLYWFGC